jgi:hypothetical protein
MDNRAGNRDGQQRAAGDRDRQQRLLRQRRRARAERWDGDQRHRRSRAGRAR